MAIWRSESERQPPRSTFKPATVELKSPLHAIARAKKRLDPRGVLCYALAPAMAHGKLKMPMRHKLAASDILSWEAYAQSRAEHRRRHAERKRDRRIEVGPYVTFYFENADTMWFQVQEMMHIEKGGAEQLEGELAAYNPLIPQGGELVATFMIEIDDPLRRARVLAGLGGIEKTSFFQIGEEKIKGAPETDQDRTSAEGKASSVQFVHFAFTPAQIEVFKKPNAQVILGLSHPAYSHMAVLGEATRAALAGDFD